MEFRRVKFAGIDGQPKYRHELVQEGAIEPFYVEASAAGIKIKGELMITKFEDQRPFAKAVADAWRDHIKVKPKIVSTLAGH